MKFTVREFVEAAEKNGLKHSRGSWFGVGSTTLSGCIMGQAAYNLTGTTDGMKAETIFNRVSEATKGAVDDIIGLNDNLTMGGRWRTYKELVTALKYRTKDYLDKVVEVDY